jgi:diguanylate cyclase (GGDEF)-like protein
MKQLERSRGNLSIVIMDIDHFKLVNDTHGHQAGDRVLVTVSRILARSDGAMLAAERLRPAT